MSKVICEREDLVAIADAVRNKTNTTAEMTLGDIASEIEGISASGSASNDTLKSLVDRTITRCDDNSIETVGASAFSDCFSLDTVSLPAATSIGDYAFSTCQSLVIASLPAATSIGVYAFGGCRSLDTINISSATSIGSYAFNACRSLVRVNLSSATSIGSYAFNGCTCLNTVYLEASTVCLLGNSNAFSGTQISSASGFIFVPASLVDSYKTATNWAQFANRIFAIGTNVDTKQFVTLEGISYQYNSGMTWGEWVESDYNTDGWYIIDDMYVCQAGMTDTVVSNTDGYVSITDTINPNEIYWVDPY